MTQGDGPAEPVDIRPGEVYDVAQWRVEEDFVNAVRHGSQYHPDFEDGVRYMQVVQAVHDSAVSGRAVMLEEVLT
jgi:predicted dehydrogenase